MKIKLICVGKNTTSFINEGIVEYANRITKYISFDIIYIKSLKYSKSSEIPTLKKQESELVFKNIEKNDFVILLDEKGKQYSSVGFSEFIEKKISSAVKNVAFVIGGAYGFSEELYKRSNESLSLSKMTFPHQLVRMIFLEQLYRAFSILNKEPYHNE
jgi:23S rRNA (pseudouridine1915-N3)-methyltransferase